MISRSRRKPRTTRFGSVVVWLCCTAGFLNFFPSLAEGFPGSDGGPDFSVFLESAEAQPSTRESIKILVSMTSEWSMPARSEIMLGPNLKWKSGDRVHTGHPGPRWQGEPDRAWTIELRAVREGRTYVRASYFCQIDDGYIHEMVVELPLQVDSDSVRFSEARPVRVETVRMGERFRYAGEFLVPIDGPEDVVPGDIVTRARAPQNADRRRVLSAPAIACVQGCVPSGVRRVGGGTRGHAGDRVASYGAPGGSEN
jgi:hypothetical protein